MKCAVIGGGAAGLMAACALARGGAQVSVFEKAPRVGKKLLATGNGRCNFTNLNAAAGGYHGATEVAMGIIRAFPPSAVLAEFEKLGVPAEIDAEGRAYPASNLASSVLDALRLTFAEAGGVEVTDFEVVSVEPAKRGFLVKARDGRAESCDKLLIATGGLAAPNLGGCADGHALLRALGHHVTKLSPVIAPIKTDTSPIRGLKGQRARCAISLLDGAQVVHREAGEVLFTETGISGICAFQLARAAQSAKDAHVSIDFAPGAGDSLVPDRARMLPKRPLEDFLNGLLSRRVGWSVLRMAGVSDLSRPVGSLSDAELIAITAALRAFRLKVTGVGGFESAQSTAGGADMREFNPATLESRIHPGLFIAGELCDVDGDCGGFNLNWAWASALAAAQGMLG